MREKKCPKCNNYTYSASKEGMWHCSICGADISEEEIEIDEPVEKYMPETNEWTGET